ncbi:MAG TPA: ornithine cyclodeaminase family protein [Patescibacteria group bacterium]|nr:ornithine cyclodeaminase family protein [Patescibacteria group bacterium]
MPRSTLLLARSDVRALLDLDECIAAVEEAFRLHAQGRTLPPGVLGVPSVDGGFHIKAAGLRLEPGRFAVKCNGNFFHNTARHDMPNIQGLILLCDADNGYPLAVIDSIEITILRTGAATAVAAKYLSRPDSRVVTIAGCGNQGRVQLRALRRVRGIEKVHAWDTDLQRARDFAEEVCRDSGLAAAATPDLSAAVRASDICVTCTPSRQAILGPDDISPGLFLAAVGADSHDKQELDPAILRRGKVVADILDQCAEIGELHHALTAGVMTRQDVHAELADIVSGRRPGRRAPDETFVFDSTGTALQDVAAADALYRRALEAGAGTPLDFQG